MRRGVRESAPVWDSETWLCSLLCVREIMVSRFTKAFRGSHRPNWPSRAGNNHSQAVFGRVDSQTCRVADPPNRPGVKRRPRWVWKSALQRARGRSYSQFELVVRGFLPATNLTGEPRNH